MKLCARCNGTKRADGAVCPACRGVGVVLPRADDPRPVELMEGRDYGLGQPPFVWSDERIVLVPTVRNGVEYSVWVRDTGVRPASDATNGIWLDELVNTACRRLFGGQGSVRLHSRTEDRQVFEYRDVWPTPTLHKVRERVKVTVVCDGMEIRRENVAVETTALPQCDVRSVILASVSLLMSRDTAGSAAWVKGKEHEIVWTIGETSDQAVSARYTIIKPGGERHEAIVEVPYMSRASWSGAVYAVAEYCREKFGHGGLRYAPELGEDVFEWR